MLFDSRYIREYSRRRIRQIHDASDHGLKLKKKNDNVEIRPKHSPTEKNSNVKTKQALRRVIYGS